LVALFVALGGTSYAAIVVAPRNSVNSSSVVNGTLQKVDLSANAVAALKGNRGAPGARGAAGAVGAQGGDRAGGPGRRTRSHRCYRPVGRSWAHWECNKNRR
jgi:hypothetical protein